MSRPRTVRARWTPTPFWADPARMAEDGIHPNAAGYTTLAELWMGGVTPLLGA
jgi:lysophospholipase L1-like esterase